MGVCVHQQYPFPLLCQSYAQVDRRCCLADTALLVGDSNDFALIHGGLPPFLHKIIAAHILRYRRLCKGPDSVALYEVGEA